MGWLAAFGVALCLQLVTTILIHVVCGVLLWKASAVLSCTRAGLFQGLGGSVVGIWRLLSGSADRDCGSGRRKNERNAQSL